VDTTHTPNIRRTHLRPTNLRDKIHYPPTTTHLPSIRLLYRYHFPVPFNFLPYPINTPVPGDSPQNTDTNTNAKNPQNNGFSLSIVCLLGYVLFPFCLFSHRHVHNWLQLKAWPSPGKNRGGDIKTLRDVASQIRESI